MILWKSKEEPETREGYPCSAFRWVFEIGKWYIGFSHQYKYKSTGEWNSSHTNVYLITITDSFILGSWHGYYDGPHCTFSLGWIHFCWGNWNCKECLPEV